MKLILKYLLVTILSFLILSCEEDLLNKEYYKPMIYIKSGENNIFSYPHAMNDSISTGYITVGSGGSMPLLNDVLVKVELAEDQLELYNYRNYGYNYQKYAKHLSVDRYIIPSYDVIIHAGDKGAATFFPIEIDANGLSPDSTYMIPVRIESVNNNYEINEKKNFVLYKIELVNAYSSQTSRIYKMKGVQQREDGIKSSITTTKSLLPLARNQVRLFPANIIGSSELQTVLDRAIILIVNNDNSVRIKPYKNIKIEQLEGCFYDPEKKTFTLNYRYRLPGESSWTTVLEILTRME